MQPEFVARLDARVKALSYFDRQRDCLTSHYYRHMRTCRICGLEKEPSAFYERKGSKYVRHECKRCANTNRRYDMVASMLSNARRANKRGLEFDLDKQFLLELRDRQNNKCALTGWSLDWDHTKSGKRKCPPTRASIDRVDSRRGYTRDNVQLLADMVNRVKSAYPQETFLEMCLKVAECFHSPKNR